MTASRAASDEMIQVLRLGATPTGVDDPDVLARRASTEALLMGPLAPGISGRTGPLGGREALWIEPDGHDPADPAVVLYLHGGAFEVGTPAAYRSFCSRLALLLATPVVALDYRRAPEHAFPAAVDDAVDAYRALLASGRPSTSIALIGDSAGGGLVMSTLITARREGLAQPAAAVGLSSWFDLTLSADSHRRCAETDPFVTTTMLRRAAAHYLVDADRRDPLASPVFASVDDLSDLAPILLHAAANEVLADDSVALADRIGAAGGDVTLEMWDEAFHVWHLAGDGIPEAADALDRVGRFVRDRIDRGDLIRAGARR